MGVDIPPALPPLTYTFATHLLHLWRLAVRMNAQTPFVACGVPSPTQPPLTGSLCCTPFLILLGKQGGT